MEDQVSVSQTLYIFVFYFNFKHWNNLFFNSDVFIGFLKAYVQQFAYKSVVTEDWKKFLYSYFNDKVG